MTEDVQDLLTADQVWYWERVESDEFMVPEPVHLIQSVLERVQVAAVSVNVADHEAALLVRTPEGDLTPAAKKVERNSRQYDWHGAVFRGEVLATTGRHNALVDLCGALCQVVRDSLEPVDLAYSLALEAAKLMDPDGHDWRAECAEMVRSFWSRDEGRTVAAPPPTEDQVEAPLAYGETAPTPEEPGKMVVDADGSPYPILRNVRTAVAMLGARIWHDDFAEHDVVQWEGEAERDLSDRDVNKLWCYAEERLRLKVAREKFDCWVDMICVENARHPLREYLAALKWDGTPRADRWLSTYASVADTEYSRAVGRLFLVAAVRRVLRPGETYQEMLLLEGTTQGKGKSSCLRALAVRREWFTDDLRLGLQAREVLEATLGKWIVEAAELVGLRRGQVQELKSFLSRDADEGRLAYDRRTVRRPRSFVIAGTTNSEEYLLDWTGNRRFWPVKTGVVDVAAMERDVDQLWAEAVVLEKKGEPIRLDPRLYPVAAVAQEEARVADPHEETLRDALGEHQDARISVADVWLVLGYSRPSDRDMGQAQRVTAAMARLGWKKKTVREGERTPKMFVRGAGAALLVVRRTGQAVKVVVQK